MMTMTVEDLSRQQLNELKEAYFNEEDIDEVLSDSITVPEQIPDDVIFKHYEGVCFTDDDFFCSSEKKRGGEKTHDEKKKYKVLIEETVVQPFFITADSAEEAKKIAVDLYRCGKLVVEGGQVESVLMRLDDESVKDDWEQIL